MVHERATGLEQATSYESTKYLERAILLEPYQGVRASHRRGEYQPARANQAEGEYQAI